MEIENLQLKTQTERGGEAKYLHRVQGTPEHPTNLGISPQNGKTKAFYLEPGRRKNTSFLLTGWNHGKKNSAQGESDARKGFLKTIKSCKEDHLRERNKPGTGGGTQGSWNDHRE